MAAPPFPGGGSALLTERRASGKRLQAADLAAPAYHGPVIHHRHVAYVTGTPLRPPMQLAAGDETGADASADLDVEDVRLVPRQPVAELAEGHQVHVVVDPDRSVVPGSEPVTDGVAVPSRHDGRGGGTTGGELYGAGNTDADAPHRGRRRGLGGEQLVEALLDAAEGLIRPEGDVPRLLALSKQLPGEVGQSNADARRAELGDEQDTRLRAEAHFPRCPASGGGMEVSVLQQAPIDQVGNSLGDD